MRVLIAGDFSDNNLGSLGGIYDSLNKKLNELGHIALLLKPENKKTNEKRIGKVMDSFYPDYIHVATDGELGLGMRKFCSKMKLDYTTACFSPEIVEKKASVRFFWKQRKCVHDGSYKVLALTNKLADFLKNNGIKTAKWIPGIDTKHYRPGSREIFARKKPILLYIYQGEAENRIESFLDLKNDGTKVVVGSGQIIDNLKERHKDVFFAGVKKGRELVDIYSSSDVLVIPEKELFFSSSVLEALSCGTPVASVEDNFAAEILNTADTGWVNDNLEEAVKSALKVERDQCRDVAMKFSLEKSARSFLNNQTIADF
jgi:glycosyltransferase involved in cell wall biosynthesis